VRKPTRLSQTAQQDFFNGDTIEVATIGNEGVAGQSVALEVPTSGNRVLVQVPGEAMRISTSSLIKASDRCPTLYRLMCCATRKRFFIKWRRRPLATAPTR
jgi:hypothetical protein